MTRYGPRSLAGQLVLIVLVALLLAQGLSLLIFADERRVALRAAGREQVLARTAGLVRLLEETPVELHQRILSTSSSPLLRFRIVERDDEASDDAHGHAGSRLARQLAALLDGNGGRPVLAFAGDDRRLGNMIGFDPVDETTGRPRFWRRPPGPPVALELAVQLPDGRWLSALTNPPPPPAWAVPSLLTLAVSATLVGCGVVLAVRRLTRPLTKLAAAADALGRGEAPEPLAEAGPADIRRTVRAFNRMQARLRRFVDDRTRMLAAISHDLRTPITSLRLRAEFIDDEETKERILATLGEMQEMIEGTLAFAREEAAAEPTRVVDLAALIDSTVGDLADLGADVTFASPAKFAYACRPVALRRALRNLIENAVRYGDRARIGLQAGPDDVRILIDDDGPGIPMDMVERVFEPFVRLEDSRSPETGGIGLGLAIARSIVRGHGGDIALHNRTGADGGTAGLRVAVILPRAASA